MKYAIYTHLWGGGVALACTSRAHAWSERTAHNHLARVVGLNLDGRFKAVYLSIYDATWPYNPTKLLNIL